MARKDKPYIPSLDRKKAPLSTQQQFKQDLYEYATSDEGLKDDMAMQVLATAMMTEPETPPGYGRDVLGKLYKRPTPVKLKGDSGPKFDPNYSRNTGYGLKGNVFPTSAEQRAEYDRMYGGTGSANAKAMEALREQGKEGHVARRARERYENSPAGRKPPMPASYSLGQLFGKGAPKR